MMKKKKGLKKSNPKAKEKVVKKSVDFKVQVTPRNIIEELPKR